MKRKQKAPKISENEAQNRESLRDCILLDSPFAYTLSLINGKYKMSILYVLFRLEVVRYNEIKRLIPGISFKSLTNTLRELEDDNLINRKEYPQIPPKVEYSLSPRGKSLIPILDSMCAWGRENKVARKENNVVKKENKW